MNRNSIILLSLSVIIGVFLYWSFFFIQQNNSSIRIPALPPVPIDVKMPNINPSTPSFDIKMQDEKNRRESEKALQSQGVGQLNLAIKSHDPKFCETITSVTDKQSCIHLVTIVSAVQGNDSKRCQTLTGSEFSDCIDAIYIHEAYGKKDKAICGLISHSGGAIECTAYVENALWMSDGTGAQDCTSYTSKEVISACTLKMSRLNDISYMNQSIQKNDSSFCKKIVDKEIGIKCFDTFIINRAKEEKDPDLCESMSEINRDTCKQAVSFSKDTDTYQIALNEKNANTCKKIRDTQLQETCIKTISTVSK